MNKVDISKSEQEDMHWLAFIEWIKNNSPNSTFGFDNGRQAQNGMDVSENADYLPTKKNFWIWYQIKEIK